jgi:very-short-patch-repair endonuclease
MKILSSEHKKAISNGLKSAHKNKKHPGWQSANRKNKSYPERLFESSLKTRGYFERFKIIDQFPFHGYFLDFAILDLKCDIEIDGIQHYRTEDARKKDEIRDSFILNKDWKVYRIPAKRVKEELDLVFEELEAFINSEENYVTYHPTEILRTFEKKSKFGSREKYNIARKKNNEEKAKKVIEELENSNIDFSKLGWVNHASKIIGVNPQVVNRWMKRYNPSFYEKCYRRKVL